MKEQDCWHFSMCPNGLGQASLHEPRDSRGSSFLLSDVGRSLRAEWPLYGQLPVSLHFSFQRVAPSWPMFAGPAPPQLHTSLDAASPTPASPWREEFRDCRLPQVQS